MEIRFPTNPDRDDACDIEGVLLGAAARVGLALRTGVVYSYGKGGRKAQSYTYDEAASVTLAVPYGSDAYRRFSRGRRLAAVCWHGHREWMREVFKSAPDAIIITALARYTGSANFEATHADTYRDSGCKCPLKVATAAAV